MTPAVFWPTLLGFSFLAVGAFTYRRDVRASTSRDGFGLAALGPVLVAASLAAFAGEHFTAAASLSRLVPGWLPARLFIAYFVGVAHLAAALSFVARRYVRWAALGLALMFALFVLLMDLPAAVTHPAIRIDWSLAARETTFAIGALALFATDAKDWRPEWSRALAGIARVWTGGVLVFYGIENVLYPQYSPGVPDMMPTAAWVPLATEIAIATGVLLIGSGVVMLVARYARAGAMSCGFLMVLLTLTLYAPQYFLAQNPAQRVTAINFVFDTLLFAGMVLVIGRAISDSKAAAVSAGAAELGDSRTQAASVARTMT